MNNLKIRQADAADDKLISTLGAVTFYEAYFEQDDAGDLAHYIHESFNPEKIAAELADSNATFFIVYRNDRAVGYAKMREGSKYECVTSENAVELQRIYIVERVFGTGVGEHLLKFCLDKARRRGFDTLFLGVWQENKRAVRFYEKHGFRTAGTITFPYGETVGTNWVMEIDLRN